MIMRMSSLFVRTLREDPADAEVPSHRLLVRAGYIRRAAPGIYTWLPLGLKVLRNIEDIIREEMDAIGAQELSFPALLPREPYEATNRWTEYGDDIFRLKDRKGADYLLGPTHEEMFTLVVKDLYSSYKDLPLSIYQIQTKYRDEARPRAGLLRGREFVMKDSYSFDVDDAGLEASYQKHRDAYIRIFDRLGFEYVIVKAISGAMGGSKSEEFLAKAAVGEDTYVRCTHLRLRRQRRGRRRSRRRRPVPYDDAPAAHAEQTPDTPTIETLVDHLNEQFPRADRPVDGRATPSRTCVVLAQAPRRHPRAARHRPARRPRGRREAPRGRSSSRGEGRAVRRGRVRGPPQPGQGLHRPRRAGGEEARPASATSLDPRVVEGTRWVTGADVAGSHVIDLVAGRDFTADGTIEAAEVRDGDPCPQRRRRRPRDRPRHRDGPHLPARPQVRRRARPQGARRERQAGHGHDGLLRHRRVPRGRGDRRGHPRRARPVLAARGRARRRAPGRRRQGRGTSSRPPSGSPTSSTGPGVEVLYDDRAGKVSPGVKFKDAELIGVPTIVVVGKGLADGTVEVKDRAPASREDVAGRPRRRPRGPPRPAHERAASRPSSSTGAARSPRWHDIDFHAESLALAQAVVNADHDVEVSRDAAARRPAARSGAAPATTSRAPTVADLFTEAGLEHDPDLLARLLRVLGAAHRSPTPRSRPLWEALRADGIKVGVLSNTIWPRELARGLLPPRRRRST